MIWVIFNVETRPIFNYKCLYCSLGSKTDPPQATARPSTWLPSSLTEVHNLLGFLTFFNELGIILEVQI